MTLSHEIKKWDGKSAEDIGKIYERHAQQPQFLPNIIKQANSSYLQKACTWLIKRHLEHIKHLEGEAAQAILELIPSLEAWESKLQLLQSLQYLQIPDKYKNTVETFTRACITDSNKFVRAWGYSGFYELARQYPAYQEEATSFMEMAMRDEPASVKARVRNIMAKGYG